MSCLTPDDWAGDFPERHPRVCRSPAVRPLSRRFPGTRSVLRSDWPPNKNKNCPTTPSGVVGGYEGRKGKERKVFPPTLPLLRCSSFTLSFTSLSRSPSQVWVVPSFGSRSSPVAPSPCPGPGLPLPSPSPLLLCLRGCECVCPPSTADVDKHGGLTRGVSSRGASTPWAVRVHSFFPSPPWRVSPSPVGDG